MDWFDFLEESTKSIQDNTVASEIRRQLLHHLESIQSQLISEGWSFEESEIEALHRMGSPKEIAQGFLPEITSNYCPVSWVICWFAIMIGAMGMTISSIIPQKPLIIVWGFMGIEVMAIIGLGFFQVGHQGSMIHRLMEMVRLLRRQWAGLVIAGVVGVLEGVRPMWWSSPSAVYMWIVTMVLVAGFIGFMDVSRVNKARKVGLRTIPGSMAGRLGVVAGFFLTVICMTINLFMPQPSYSLPAYIVVYVELWVYCIVVGIVTEWWFVQRHIMK